MTMFLKEYKGLNININCSNGRFSCETGDVTDSTPEFSRGDSIIAENSLKAIEEAIDKHLQAKGKRLEISLPVVNRFGDPCTITQIHLGTSKIIVSPKVSGGGDVYIDTPKVRELTTAIKVKAAELAVMQESLKTFQVRSNFGHGRMDPSRVEKNYNQLLESYNAAEIASQQG